MRLDAKSTDRNASLTQASKQGEHRSALAAPTVPIALEPIVVVAQDGGRIGFPRGVEGNVDIARAQRPIPERVPPATRQAIDEVDDLVRDIP